MNRLLKYIAWAEDHKIQWSADQVQQAIGKISLSLNEKSGEQMMMNFFHSIAEENTSDPVYLLDKYWRSYADLRIKTVYNIPRIISNLKNKNPNLRGEKFYSRIQQILVKNNSPWLQLYFDFDRGYDSKGNPVNLETIQKTYQWPRIEEELKRIFTPMNRRNQSEMNYEKELASKPTLIALLKKYDTPENRDAANKINAICIVWNQYNNEFKAASSDLNVLKRIISTWESYMKKIYTELSKIPTKYVTLYDQYQIEKLLNDEEHYGALNKTIAAFESLPENKSKINRSRVYKGLKNMYLAAKGQPIIPFAVKISTESVQQQKQYEYDLDKATAFNSGKNKSQMLLKTYLDKFGKVNPLIALMEKNTFTQEDCEQIQDVEDLKSTIDYFKTRLISLSNTLAQEVVNTSYDLDAFDEVKVNKLFSRPLYGNINNQIKLMTLLEKKNMLDFENSFNGTWLWKCIDSMYNYYKTGTPPIIVGLPHTPKLKFTPEQESTSEQTPTPEQTSVQKQNPTLPTTAISRLRKLRR